MSDQPILQLHKICKQFDAKAGMVVDHVSLELQAGEILGLLGPSGCGKTTLLRVVAGFEQPQAGQIDLSGQLIADGTQVTPPEDRDIGMVFQDYALFPHLSVAKNIAFGLTQPRRKRFTNSQIKDLTQEAIDLVGLSGLEQRYPHELSGGQQQRVALARAIAPQPTIILLDEPLSNLDVQVRLRLRQEVRRILKTTNTSAIFVTHDQEEAMAICDRVGIMQQGQIEQIGPPEMLYNHPQSRFVADFVTQANFLPATLKEKHWHTEVGIFPAAAPVGNTCELMIRQEDVQLQADETSRIVVRDRQFLGREYQYCAVLPSGKSIYARAASHNQIPAGSYVKLQVDPDTVTAFPID
ncbi:ABC transporter ATP-binding protein [filamentous cyanobacterium LEGE 11480]|uniref:ABC-type quaternary amine transporter n=1 Tax=Romeriopsis navalis LEGE 11480 TaxID=2777977 RepID=A0A928Z2K9_9CYAN|nr:ABC transporter ATP-binding protein [Romeriopsis navalis]MBE9029162.1 ABC transporter ATP-binding protein [Romeriopsis navalis LEGE 11480]